VGLRRACWRIRSRLAVPVGGRHGRVRGYASRAERLEKQRRLHQLTARLESVEVHIAQGRVSVVRGGRRLLRTRQHLGEAGLTEPQWRRCWEAARWFVTADGEADKPLGNETIRVHPEEGWLELKLPLPLAHLANRPHGRYRLSCPVRFSYRAEAWAAVASLSPKLREALLLVELFGLTYREAAEVLRVPEGTVKSRVFQARLRLAAWRSEEGRAGEL